MRLLFALFIICAWTFRCIRQFSIKCLLPAYPANLLLTQLIDKLFVDLYNKKGWLQLLKDKRIT